MEIRYWHDYDQWQLGYRMRLDGEFRIKTGNRARRGTQQAGILRLARHAPNLDERGNAKANARIRNGRVRMEVGGNRVYTIMFAPLPHMMQNDKSFVYFGISSAYTGTYTGTGWVGWVWK